MAVGVGADLVLLSVTSSTSEQGELEPRAQVTSSRSVMTWAPATPRETANGSLYWRESESDIVSRWVHRESNLMFHIEQQQRSMEKVTFTFAFAQCKCAFRICLVGDDGTFAFAQCERVLKSYTLNIQYLANHCDNFVQNK